MANFKAVNPHKQDIYEKAKGAADIIRGLCDANGGFLKLDRAVEALNLPIRHGEKILVAKALKEVLGYEKIYLKPDGGYFYRPRIAMDGL